MKYTEMVFQDLAQLVAAATTTLVERDLPLFVTANGEEIKKAYLDSFPEGTNQVYKERREYDCGNCLHYLQNFGGVVGVDNDTKLRFSVWDLIVERHDHIIKDTHYYPSILALRDLVREAPIQRLFLRKPDEVQVGCKVNHELYADPKDPLKNLTRDWFHFHGKVTGRHVHGLSNSETESIDAALSKAGSHAAVLNRALAELTTDSLSTVKDLIENGALYRGEEMLPRVELFMSIKDAYDATNEFYHLKQQEPDYNREAERRFHAADFAWSFYNSPAARFRSSAIGSLVVDLDKGEKSLEACVASYQEKVAPQNYAHPTRPITTGMINKALETVDKLDLRPALDRRHAVSNDISIADTLYLDRSTFVPKDPLGQLLSDAVPKPARSQDYRAEMALNGPVVPIEQFVRELLPRSTDAHVFFHPQFSNNLVSLTAPVHEDSGRLFKWANPYGWSYRGSFTDAITERVKAAGGSVDGSLRFSLSWDGRDDLDIHTLYSKKRPAGKMRPDAEGLYYGTNGRRNFGAWLDVDANAGSIMENPVENVIFQNAPPADGFYEIAIHLYSARQSQTPPPQVQIAERDGFTNTYTMQSSLNNNRRHSPKICVEVENGRVAKVTCDAGWDAEAATSDPVWGITPYSMLPVNIACFSPNHWRGESIGNKHYIFGIKECLNPDPVRTIYNEFLAPELHSNRKVFNVLGEKTKAPYSESQISGLGFSSTLPAVVPFFLETAKGPEGYQVKVGA